jgi:hypothetical protein
LPLISFDRRFYVLALSQNQVRVFEASFDGITELEVAGVPQSLAEVLSNRGPERQLQSHVVTGQGGQHSPVFFGHGAGEEDKKEKLAIWCRQVEAGIRDLLARDGAPVILAAVDYVNSIYRETNPSAELLEEWIAGNPDRMPPHELHQKAAPIARTHFRTAQDRVAAQYLELAHTGRASNILADVLPAARQGRVDSLLVAVGVQVWGRFDPQTNTTSFTEQPTPDDEDLLNLAAVHTYTRGGSVYAVPPDEVPGGKRLAAIYRY